MGLERGSAARAKASNVIAHFFHDKIAVITGPMAVAVLPVEREACVCGQLGAPIASEDQTAAYPTGQS